MDGATECLADNFDRDPVVDLLEESLHNHVHSFFPRNPATHAVENLVLIYAACRCTVSTSNIVGFNLEAGNRIAACVVTQHQRITALITVRLLRGGINFYHAAPNDTSIIPQHFFVQQIAVRSLRLMMLLGVITDLLPITGKRDAVHFGSGSATVQIDVLMNVGQFAAQTDDRPLQRSVAAYDTRLMGKVPRILIPILQLHIS